MKKFQKDAENEPYIYMCVNNDELDVGSVQNKPRSLLDVEKSSGYVQSVNLLVMLFMCIFASVIFI